MTGLWFPIEVKDFLSSLCVQTGSEASPASYPMGTCGPFPGLKRGWGVTLTVHPHLVPRSRVSRRCISSPPWRLRGGSGTTLALSYRQIHCPSVYVTISIFYCKWEHETRVLNDLLITEKQWELILVVSCAHSDGCEKLSSNAATNYCLSVSPCEPLPNPTLGILVEGVM
jgi:hypothetical protein